MTGRRLLLTGATGFLGRHILSAAVEAGFEVHCVARNPEKVAELEDIGAEWHIADLLSADSAAGLVASIVPSHIIHAAWDTRHGAYWTSLENMSWVAATLRIIEAFAHLRGKRFVQIGSCAATDGAELVADISKLAKTGWTQAVPLKEGLHATYLWWAERVNPAQP